MFPASFKVGTIKANFSFGTFCILGSFTVRKVSLR